MGVCFFRAYDPSAFKHWASKGACPGIPAVRELFATLQDKGFRVFLLTGRDEERLGSCTSQNLESEGFSGYDRLMMRYEHLLLFSSVNFKHYFFPCITARDHPAESAVIPLSLHGSVCYDNDSCICIKCLVYCKTIHQ